MKNDGRTCTHDKWYKIYINVEMKSKFYLIVYTRPADASTPYIWGKHKQA